MVGQRAGAAQSVKNHFRNSILAPHTAESMSLTTAENVPMRSRHTHLLQLHLRVCKELNLGRDRAEGSWTPGEPDGGRRDFG